MSTKEQEMSQEVEEQDKLKIPNAPQEANKIKASILLSINTYKRTNQQCNLASLTNSKPLGIFLYWFVCFFHLKTFKEILAKNWEVKQLANWRLTTSLVT